jgi:hypothetical protein
MRNLDENWSVQNNSMVCPSSVPSNFWELPKNGRGLSVHPFRPIFGSFQKMDGVCPSSVGRCLSVVRSVLFLGASKKWTESVHRPCSLIFGSFQKMEEVYRNCPSSVLSNFWELPKKLTESVHRPCRSVFGSFQERDVVCLSFVPSNFWELQKNWRSLSIVRAVQFLGVSEKWTRSIGIGMPVLCNFCTVQKTQKRMCLKLIIIIFFTQQKW